MSAAPGTGPEPDGTAVAAAPVAALAVDAPGGEGVVAAAVAPAAAVITPAVAVVAPAAVAVAAAAAAIAPAAPAPAAPGHRRSSREQRWERRRRRRAFEEVLGWILVPAILYGTYWFVDASLAALGTSPGAVLQGLQTILSNR
jgi:hypothetical protein